MLRPSQKPIGTPAGTRASVIIQFPIPDSEFGLVAALRSSHPDAILALCERYSNELLVIAARVLGPDRGVRLLVIEVLRQAIARIGEAFEARQFRYWLVSQLMSEVQRRLRARRRWGRFARSSMWYWTTAVRFGELHRAAYRILDRMPEAQRLVFCLVVVHKMDLEQVMTLLGVDREQAEQTLLQAQGAFLRLSRRFFRDPSSRRLRLLSFATEIVREQDVVLKDWTIAECDVEVDPERTTRGRVLFAVTLVSLLLVLLCAVALLVSLVLRDGLPR